MHSGLVCLPPSSLCPGQQLQVRLPDLSSYGDGLVWGAALLLHSLGQTAHFKLTDLTTLLLESHQFGWRSTSLHLTSTPTADSCLSWSMSSHNCMFAAHCCLSSSNVNPHLSVMKMLLTSSGYVQLQCRSCFKTQNLLLLLMWSLTTCNKDCASCRVKHRQARLCSFCHKGACPKMHPQPGANNAVCHSASVASINCPEEKQSQWSRAMLCSRFSAQHNSCSNSPASTACGAGDSDHYALLRTAVPTAVWLHKPLAST